MEFDSWFRVWVRGMNGLRRWMVGCWVVGMNGLRCWVFGCCVYVVGWCCMVGCWVWVGSHWCWVVNCCGAYDDEACWRGSIKYRGSDTNCWVVTDLNHAIYFVESVLPHGYLVRSRCVVFDSSMDDTCLLQSLSNQNNPIVHQPFFDVNSPNTWEILESVVAFRTAVWPGHSGAFPP